MQNTTILKKNKNMVTRKIADETILLPIYRTSKEINCIYTLNKPASIVWDMIDGKTTVGEIKDKVLNNGFDLIKDSAYRIKDKEERGKDEGLRIKDKEQRGKQREREREEKEKLQSRDRACPVLKLQKQEVDSQLKVFFKELREIKAVIKDKGKRIKVKVERKQKRSSPLPLSSPLKPFNPRNKRGRKMKFRPEITRVKLNPEQAVLTCDCWEGGYGFVMGGWGDLSGYFRVGTVGTACIYRCNPEDCSPGFPAAANTATKMGKGDPVRTSAGACFSTLFGGYWRFSAMS